jgi:hypothetical protein
MSQTYATPEDLANLPTGPNPTAEQIQFLLDMAFVKVQSKAPLISARLVSGRVSSDAIKLVLLEMVQAVLRNPTGQRSGSETTGPWGRSWSWDPVSAAGRLEVTDEHLTMLGETSTAYTVGVRDDGMPLPRRLAADEWCSWQ